MAAHTANAVGNWITVTAIWGLAFFRFDVSEDTLAVLVVVLSMAAVVASGPAGTIVDRMGPKKAFLVACLCGAASAAALTTAGSYAAVMAFSVPLAACDVLSSTAVHAFVPRLVAGHELPRVNGVVTAAENVAVIVGPAAAAGLFEIGGLEATFAADAVSFLLAAGLLAWAREAARPELSPHPRVEEPPSSGHHSAEATANSPRPRDGEPDWRTTLEVVRVSKPITWVLTLAAITYAMWAVFAVVEPLYVDEVLGASGTAFALLQAAFGSGVVGGGLALAKFGRRVDLFRALGYSTILSCAGASVYVSSRMLALAYAGIVLWGVAVAWFTGPARTILQTEGPAVVHGRILALNKGLEPAAMILFSPLAAYLAGSVGAQLLGVATSLVVGAAGLAFSVAVRSAGLGMRPTRQIRTPGLHELSGRDGPPPP